MLVINIIAALMGIAAAGACAVLAGHPAGVGKMWRAGRKGRACQVIGPWRWKFHPMFGVSNRNHLKILKKSPGFCFNHKFVR